MKRKNIIFTLVFLVSFISLLTEILLIRIFSVTLWYHFAFFVISITMFGLSLGGTIFFIFKKQILKIDFEKVLYGTIFAIPIVFLPIILIIPKISFSFDFGLKGYLGILILFLVSQLPFFLIGFLMSYLFLHFNKESGKLYFFDLIGASAGALFSVAVINYLGAINSLIFLGIVSSAALILISNHKKMKISLFILMIFVFLLILNSEFDIVGINKAKGKYMNNLFTKWNSYSMVRVYGDEKSLKPSPFGWAMSPIYEGLYPPKLDLDIDASAYTPITKFDGDFKKIEFLKYDLSSFAYHVWNPSKVMIIGPGGGRDILAALIFGAKKVIGVELNPIIANDIMKNRFKEYSGNLYLRDDVEIILDEARSYIRNSKENYDVIQASLVDTWAATNAGAYSLSENNLYTVEAIAEFMNHLTENGYLTISRGRNDNSLKLTIQYIKAAEKLGIKNTPKHIAIIGGDKIVNHIFKKTEFNDDEIEMILNLSDRLQFEVLYLPNMKINNEYNKIIKSKNLDLFIQGHHSNLKPSTDDNPFFFNNKRIRSVPSILLGITKDAGIFLLYGLFIITSVLVFILIIIPVYFKSKEFLKNETKSKFLYLIYFCLLGASFIIIEITFLQKFMIFLGHPIYSITVVIFSLLLFAGIGSLLTHKIIHKKLKSSLKIVLLLIVGIICFYNISLYPLFNKLLGLNIEIKIIISILLLSVMGILMGMPFPIGMRLVGLKYKELIPFYWSLNGAFSVLGSVLAVILSMNIGFTKTIFIAAILYLIAYAIFRFYNDTI